MKAFCSILFLLALIGTVAQNSAFGNTVDRRDLQSHEKMALLRWAGFERNITLGGSLVLLAASVLIVMAHRVKKRNVFQLQLLQAIIHRQNQAQQKLLEEKDLLMKEVHHRVKNGFNIILSLLESQSHYLSNTAARTALQDTQNRLQAVFLLHQKLYGSAGISAVNVNTYVLDLVNYLYETFDIQNRNVVITHNIEPIYLDSHDVLPLAIILNEAITNAFKYAFPNGRHGQIRLMLQRMASGMIQMQIRDNGVGLPAGYHAVSGQSLGFTLITGLANQLEGYCGIEEEEGVVITIRFMPKVA